MNGVRGEQDDRRRIDPARKTTFGESTQIGEKCKRPRRRDPRAKVARISMPASFWRHPRVVRREPDLNFDRWGNGKLVATCADMNRAFPRDPQPRWSCRQIQTREMLAPFRGTSIEQRKLRTLDAQRDAVANPETSQRREHMLDSGEPNPCSRKLDSRGSLGAGDA